MGSTEETLDISKHGKRDSLVHQASVERIQNAVLKRQNVEQHRKEIEKALENARILKELNDEGIEVIWSSGDDVPMTFAAILAAEGDSAQFLSSVMLEFEACGVHLRHLETRPEQKSNGMYTAAIEENEKINVKVKFDIFVDCECTKNAFLEAAKRLTEKNRVTRLSIYKNDELKFFSDNLSPSCLHHFSNPWFPRHISDLDQCYHCLVKYEPTTDPRHPGYGDQTYIERREKLNAIAKAYKFGETLPDIEYTAEEHKTWEAVFIKLKSLHPSHTCVEYQQNFKQMEQEGLLEPTRIPKLSRVNKYLQRKTGFTLRPCGGLLSARDFLASLAFRVFQTTIYIRHHKSPHHSPEPDLIHEFIGHCPMFADPIIAQFSQQIGILSLGATDEQIEQLATVYWFIIEFGLCRQNGQLRAIGAGLLSSYGELMHACSVKPRHEEFDPWRTALQKYEDSDYQPLYFVASSIFDAMAKLRVFALSFKRPFAIVYNPYTQSVEVVKEACHLKYGLDRFKAELSSFTEAVEALSNNIINQ